ncbi:carboxymuconolactone decarboxylase family protein [Pelatocladus sp. BLCC-F211]|uniref:carboxymuconolactone decarboxylase family protein n=1 Tax=Pelatocladus sp. BLCC-F211 TaxID=3342752 RepID=UPI0035B7D3DC
MKYLRPIKPNKYTHKDDLLNKTYAQIQQEALPISTFTMHSVSPKLFAGNWSLFREVFLVDNQVSREVKEAINLAVSKLNTCPYCVDAHSIMLSGLKHEIIAIAIVNNDLNTIADPKFISIVEWALSSNQPNHPLQLNPPFNNVEAPEIIGAALNFHYTNRLVNIFLNKAFIPLPFGKGIANWVVRKVMIKTGLVGSSRNAGKSLVLLPEANLPDDFKWAASNPFIAQALSRYAAVVEESICKFVSPDVRNFVEQNISKWDGQNKGISRQWVETLTNELDLQSKAIAKLALLTAFSSFQVDKTVIDEFKTYFSLDEELLAVVVWASFYTARVIASWTSVH